MSAAKDEILGNIRGALSKSARPGLSYDAVERHYRKAGILEGQERLQLFEDRLRDYGSEVFVRTEEQLPAAIAHALSSRGKQGLILPPGLPGRWLPDGFSFRRDENIAYEELDRSEGVLTGCALAIAETGTIVLRHSEQEGRRALTLIPDYHLCVVYAEQVVESVVEGFRQMNEFSRVPITTISGPSATSDIEMIRVQGVHGPRTLDVILVVNPLEHLESL
jgi:L-lactate dehydrogenase complex protein LldG